MKKFMTSDELRRDDRFVRAHIPLEFLMSDSVTAEGVETMMKNMKKS